MFPTLIDLGTHELPLLGEVHLFLPTYGALFAAAVLVAWWWFLRRARTLEIPESLLFDLTFYTLIAGIVGAKLALVLVDWRFYLAQPRELLGTLRSAGVLMGGVIAGAAAFTWFARRHDLPLFRLGDAIAAPLVLAQAIGRLGCLSAGCCWGVACAADNPFAVTFTDPRANAQTGVPLHQPLVATQLIEMLFDLALATLLALAWKRGTRTPGVVFWLYVTLYSAGRFVIEIWRGDAHRGVYLAGTLSTSQILSLAGFAIGAVMLARGVRAARASGR